MDKLNPEQRSANMRAIRSKDMAPELMVRKLVHGMGYRYRLHRRELPGKPDLVFVARRKVIFVHGCFWHQHNSAKCSDSRLPKSNQEYWNPKLERNTARDRQQVAALKRLGWKVLVVWECETKHPSRLVKRLQTFLG